MNTYPEQSVEDFFNALVVFASLDDLNVYQPHEVHQQFIEANKAIWDEVLVVDSEIL